MTLSELLDRIWCDLRALITPVPSAERAAVLDELRKSLETYSDNITAAFAYGSVAKGTDKAESNIDVMIVGDELDLARLYAALQSAGSVLLRKISPLFLSSREWQRRKSEKGSFINKISTQPKIFIIGSQRDLRV